jgi:predicted aconitase with swiveling domain
MDSGSDTVGINDRTMAIYARIAGLSFLFAQLFAVLFVVYVMKDIVVLGDDAATVENVVKNEMRFRVGVAGEIVVYAVVIPLSLALYVILKRVNKNLALLALLLRTAEAILGALIAMLAGVIPLLLLDGEAAFGRQYMEALTGLFFQVREGWDVVAIFYGAGGAIFCYLLFKAKCIPRIISAWGLVANLIILIKAPINIIMPDFAQSTMMMSWAFSGSFEVVIGTWLLIWGVDCKFLKQQASTASSPA